MIVKRQKEKTSLEVDLGTSTSKPVFGISEVEITSYREEAIMVLNKLESEGVNIYESGRYGGMYLKQKKNVNKTPQIFQNKKTKNVEKPETVNNQELKNFFKNNKK